MSRLFLKKVKIFWSCFLSENYLRFKMGIFSRISGIDKLAEKFPAAGTPSGQEFKKQTIQIGPVRYRNCLTVIINSSGLYLLVTAPFIKTHEIFIPWEEFYNVGSTRLYSQKAVKLNIGKPSIGTISVYESLHDQFKSNLNNIS